ncbi:glycosyltransferase family 2 protein [Parathielavia appendiculata]|uniref:chitin synthase n=1 Tax=Parathielavia appendiculata TaxID=2587402 RepID=A0AAN6Z5W0_9PEZI|nr:glycosyltransferase family 2 protein [Parathielavia appendiculata]
MVGNIEETWPLREIVYTAIVGLVMLAALLEWFLWIAAFLYCLWKVFVKAEHWTVRVLAVLVGVAFTLLRFIFLPIMIVTLPLPSQIVRIWPPAMVSFLQWFAFWSFAGLLTIPWLFCVYQIVTHQLGRTKRIKQVLDEVSAPKVVIVMPCYKEEPEVLVTAINSVVDCDYPPSCIHVFLSFDGDQEDELYLNTIEKLGVPLTLESYPKSIDVTYKAARITVSRFPHGGKRHCQKMTFKLIDKVYREYLRRNDNLFILFIDSDCILDRVCLQNFVYDMELSPGNRRDMLAMTGVITSTTRKHSLITLLQDMEYIHGQLFERTVESGCGAVTCLPGALTMLRFSAFRRMAKYYFADKAEQCEDLFDFAKSHLGEDRWLTHLFMIGAKKRYQIQMCTSAFCKTEAVQTMRSLIKQRRRWFLGFITNEVCMLTDWRLWKRYPILVLVRFMQNTIRTTALLFFIMVLALMTTTKTINDLPVGFIAISLGLNWLMMIYFGAKLRRFKIWLYPLMFVLNPFFNWYYMVYGIFTAGQRTWGGPRADAAAADATTTAQEAIEQAEQTGDDLNIVPESFIPAAQERKELAEAEASKEGTILTTKTMKKQKPTITTTGITTTVTGSGTSGVHRTRSVLLQPPDKLIGKFAAPERTPSGWYQHPDDSVASIGYNLTFRPATTTTTPYHHHPGNNPTTGLHHLSRESFDSALSAYTTGNTSVYMPQRVESLMGEEDRRKYELAAQASGSHNHGQSQLVASLSPSSSRVWGPPSSLTPLSRPQQTTTGIVYEVGDGDGDEMMMMIAGGSSGSASSRAGSVHESHQQQQSQSQFQGGSTDSLGEEGGTAGKRQSLIPHLNPPPPPPQTVGGRSGRSPLGRASWTRPVTRDEVELAMEGVNAPSNVGKEQADQRGKGW